MKTIRAPRFLNDLYRDLRDRRLLIPAAALVAALIAVPALLSSSSSSGPVAPLAPAAQGGPRAGTAVQPAVLTRELGNTDYGKRLQRSQAKNPFRRQYALPKVTSKVKQSSLTGSSIGSTGTTSTGTASGAATGSSTSQPAQSPPAAPPTPTHPQLKLFAYRASVAIGPAGALVRRDNVKRLNFLPYDSKPMVAFLGVTENAKSATFLISDDVSSVDGDGHCVPGRNSCKFLELKPGDKASLAWAPQGDKTFNLKLLGISLSPLHSSHGGNGKTSSLPTLGPDG